MPNERGAGPLDTPGHVRFAGPVRFLHTLAVIAVLALLWPNGTGAPDGRTWLSARPWTGGTPVLIGLMAPQPAAAASIGVGLDGMTIDFGSVSPKDGPRVLSRAVHLAVVSDAPWEVTVAAASDLVNDDPTVPPLPAARLQWALDSPGDTGWQPLTTAPAVVAAGAGGEDPTLLPLSFRLTVEWEDMPAATPYRTTVVYTASQGAALAASFARPLPGEPGGPVRYTIGYWVPGDGPVQVRIQLARDTRETVRTVVLEQTGGRWHTWEWDGLDDAGKPLPPGPYYYTVTGPHGRVLAAGLCYPPDDVGQLVRALQVRMLNAAVIDEPMLRVEARAEPERVMVGDWLRLHWTVANAGSRPVTGVILDVELPEGWRPVTPDGAGGVGATVRGPMAEVNRPGTSPQEFQARPGSRRWSIAIGDLEPEERRNGDVWIAVAPGTPAGTHLLTVTARGPAQERPLSAPVRVPVTVAAGPFDTGRLVARAVFAHGTPSGGTGNDAARASYGGFPAAGITFRVLGGPRLRTDPDGVLTWSGAPGLYVLVPEPATLPAGWHAGPIPFRLEPGGLTYVDIPLVPRSEAGTSRLQQGTLAGESGPDGTRLVSVLTAADGAAQFEVYYRNDLAPSGETDQDGDHLAAADVLMPLGLPWSGPMDLYVAGHRRRGVQDGWHGAVMAGGRLGALWGLHVVDRRPAGAAGLLWLHDGESGQTEVVGTHWQAERGRTRVGVQGLWRPSATHVTGAAAWGITAAAPLGDHWQVEGTYRWVEPEFSVPGLEKVPPRGWTVGLGWRPPSGTEWRTTLEMSDREGLHLALAGRLGTWHLSQGLLQGGQWRPATSVRLQLPGTGLWLGVRTEEPSALHWQMGGSTGQWTWSLQAGGPRGGEARLGWRGEGAFGTHWWVQAGVRAGADAAGIVADAADASRGLLGRVDWRVYGERPADDGGRWHGKLLWRPQDPDVTTAAALGWRGPWAADGRWFHWEILWQRGSAGESWEAAVGGRWRLADDGEVSGQLLLRRTWRAAPGALYTGQVSLTGRQRWRGSWYGLGGIRWWTQWSDGGGGTASGTELDLGLSRELGDGWRLSAGWRWSFGPARDGGGPFAQLEWQPITGAARVDGRGEAVPLEPPQESLRGLP